MDELIDLHVHSTASDGDLPPAELVEMALEKGLRAIALTDHDTIDGLPALFEAARLKGLEVVGGVEVGPKNDKERGFKEVHVLGYFLEPGDHPLAKALERLARAKMNWAERQVARLVDEGFSVPFDEVRKVAEGSATIRRPHIWKVLSRNNPGKIEAEDFFRTTDFGESRYVGKEFEVTLEEAIELIEESGGISVLAHPAFYGQWPEGPLRVLDHACAAGVAGVETLYAYDVLEKGPTFPTQAQVAALLEEEARKRGLVLTGGSDFHGEVTKAVHLGEVAVPYDYLERLKAARASRRSRRSSSTWV